MNPINLISATLALGAMMGISGTHFRQVKSMVDAGAHIKSTPVNIPHTLPAGNDAHPISDPIPVSFVSTSPRSSTSVKSVTAKNPLQATKAKLASVDQRESALMEIFVSIRDEQKNLRSQLSNTNRNMDELTFRVDSHSTQFRPLQTDPGARPRAMVVPDDEYGGGMNPGMMPGQVLPPKQ